MFKYIAVALPKLLKTKKMPKKEKQVRVGSREKVEDPKFQVPITIHGSLAKSYGCEIDKHPTNGKNRIKPGTAKELQRTIVNYLNSVHGTN